MGNIPKVSAGFIMSMSLLDRITEPAGYKALSEYGPVGALGNWKQPPEAHSSKHKLLKILVDPKICIISKVPLTV